MNCIVCGTPVRGRNTPTCSSYCNDIRKSGLTREEYERRESQIPHHGDEHTLELDDQNTVERVVKMGMTKDL